ncbi:MAG TPA: hypothetical protein DCR93_12755, partial [Cytophagales bacterium]|nr:hypothetical protein [Cytophagales bacterium]
MQPQQSNPEDPRAEMMAAVKADQTAQQAHLRQVMAEAKVRMEQQMKVVQQQMRQSIQAMQQPVEVPTPTPATNQDSPLPQGQQAMQVAKEAVLAAQKAAQE